MKTKKKSDVPAKVGDVPHSWSIETWPQHVFPNDPRDARNLIRFYRDQLVAAKALTRIGRRLVIMGDKYDAWLRAQASAVELFESPFIRNKGKA